MRRHFLLLFGHLRLIGLGAGRVLGALEQLLGEISTLAHRTGGEFQAPMVLRLPCGPAGTLQEAGVAGLLASAEGLAVASPSTASDAAGLLRAAVRHRGPVVLLEPLALYGSRGPVAELPTPIGTANTVRPGRHVTLLAWGAGVGAALTAAEQAATQGYEAEVIDLRSLVPLDIDTVIASVRRTGRCVVASQTVLNGSFVNEVVARVVEEAFDDLDGPVARVGARNGISPQAESLEQAYLPHPSDIVAAVKGLI